MRPRLRSYFLSFFILHIIVTTKTIYKGDDFIMLFELLLSEQEKCTNAEINRICVQTIPMLMQKIEMLEAENELLQQKINDMQPKTKRMPKAERVLINGNAMIVFFSDGTKSVAKCHPKDVFNKEAGFAICLAKRFISGKTFHAELDRLGLLLAEDKDESQAANAEDEILMDSEDISLLPSNEAPAKVKKSDKQDKKKSDTKKSKKTK